MNGFCLKQGLGFECLSHTPLSKLPPGLGTVTLGVQSALTKKLN